MCADKLRWLDIEVFPGVDTSTQDALIQPSRGLGVMRSMVGADPFVHRGVFQPEPGFDYAYDWVTAGYTLQGLTSAVINGNQYYLLVVNGKLWRPTGVDGQGRTTWSAITSSILGSSSPMAGASRVRFARGWNALFMTDGISRPKVFGWNFSPDDKTLHWDDEHNIAELLYTMQKKTDPTDATDDFYATGCCVHRLRLVLWKDDWVRVSDAQKPTTFYDEDNPVVMAEFFRVAEEDGLPITNAISYENQMLIVSKPFSLHGYVGDSPATAYSRVILDNERGAYAGESLCVGQGRVWFCSHEGPCMLDIKTGVTPIGASVQEYWDAMTEAQKQQVIGWFEDGRYYLVLPIQYTDGPSGPSGYCVKLFYDVLSKRWGHGYGIDGLCTQVQTSTDKYMTTANDNGVIYRQNHGSNVNQELVTPWLTFGTAWRYKWFRSLRVSADTIVDDMTMEYATDDEDDWTPIEFEEPPVSVAWGDSVNHVHWNDDGLEWLSSSKYVIETAHSVHCRKLRLRIRGRNMTLRAMGIGFEYEGVA